MAVTEECIGLSYNSVGINTNSLTEGQAGKVFRVAQAQHDGEAILRQRLAGAPSSTGVQELLWAWMSLFTIVSLAC